MSEKNRAGYDEWAAFYDHYPNPTVALDELCFPSYWNGLRNCAVLEIGCGTGRHTRKLLAQGNRVTALEPSAGMLAVAREKLGEEARFLPVDFYEAELEPEEFDAILASLVLEHLPNLPEFFVKARHHLRAGGRVYLSEIHPSRTAAGVAAHFRRPGSSEEVWLESYPHTAEEIALAAGDAGLTVVRCDNLTGSEALAALDPKWARHLGQPMLQVWVLERP